MNLPNDHIVKSYDEEQQRLVAEIVRMGVGGLLKEMPSRPRPRSLNTTR